MLDLYAELRRIVEALDAAGIAYALAGGLAVSIHTTPRATEDIDILIARAAQDQRRGSPPAGPPDAERSSTGRASHGALRALKRLRGSALDRADLEALGPEE